MRHASSLREWSSDGKYGGKFASTDKKSFMTGVWLLACLRVGIAAPLFGAAVFACCAWASASVAQEAAADADGGVREVTAAEVQEKLRQWVKTQQLISGEKAGWEAEKSSLADLNELREQEAAQLDELIATAGTRLSDAETRLAELNEEEESLRTQRAEKESRIGELEAGVRSLLPGFPAPLLEQLGDAVERLQDAESGHGSSGAPLQNRYRDVLAVLTEAGAFDSRLTLDTELREIDGRTLEVQVLYLGLANAYFTDRSGAYSGTGKPATAAGGWEWSVQPELAASIQQTIGIFQKQASPELVKLPLQIRSPE